MATKRERVELLLEAQGRPELQSRLMWECQNDPLFWFDWFAYTFNPRSDDPHMAFNLYPFQRELVGIVVDCIRRGEPLIIEKSRDMGISWLIMLIFQWCWLFMDGADLLVGSSKEALVDEKGNRSTLFEKLRYNSRFLPMWMLPELGKSNDAHMKILNPYNGNVLTGEAAVADFGRGQRYRAVLMDEVARQPFGQLAYESVSQSTNCTILLFTPFGKANIAYRMRAHKDVEWIKMDGQIY